MSRSTRRSLPLIALVVILLTSLLPAASLAQGPDDLPHSTPSAAPDLTNNISLNLLGRYAGIGAEISAYDPATKRLYVTGPQLQIVDIANPAAPTLVSTIAIDATSVAVKDGIVAAAVPANPIQDPGQVVFLTPAGAELKRVTVGALPDMLTFTPDGTKVLVANEGEPGATDPEGSVSVIDISAGVASATVATASFTAFNDHRAELVNRGVRIFPSAASVAQDLEPEYIAVAPDGVTARVTLQEANAVAVLDIASATITQILPLGLKDHRGLPRLATYPWRDLPVLGQAPSALAGVEDPALATLPDAPTGVQINLGGFSGLFFEGKTVEGALKFVTHTDRGPNGEPTDLISYIPGRERPFPMPKFQPELVRFELDPASGKFTITQRIGLTQPDGVKMTGLPNLQAAGQGMAYTDEVPIDLFGNQLANRPLGIDPEGIVVALDGTFWMVEEYRPSILHFDAAGKLLARYIPEGTAAAVGAPAGTFGVEALPAVYAQRRANRGFEAIALEGSKVYTFIQSALDNPDAANDATSRASRNLRIVEFDTLSQTVTAEYLYNLRDISSSGDARTDKIGDAVSLANGRFAVIERDDRLGLDANKLIYEIDLKGATDIHNPANLVGVPAGKTLEQLTEAELAVAGIKPVFKRLATNLAPLGYTGVSKPEGLAVVDDATLAVINDNDFGILAQPIPGDGTLPMNPNPEPVLLGLVRFNGPAGLDASDRDGDGGGKRINIQPWPVFGMYMPDGIASFSVGGQAFYATANEGDARSDPARIGTLNLDPTAFPNGTDLKNNAALGRLNASSIDGDVDGDGDYDRLYAYGSRSFTIWDAAGNPVADSGDAFERITASQTPALFNANDGSASKWDERSDDKGPEPEGITVGTIAGRPYAFIGLERAGGGVMVYDLGNPRQPQFVGYFRTEGDVSPEGVLFIPALDSPTGSPLVVLTHEFSLTTSIYEVKQPGTTNDAAYVKPAASDVSLKALLTVGETVPLMRDPSKDYRMVGIPDGLGAYKDEQGNVHLLVNHELRNTVATQPIVDGPSVKGAFISHYLLAGDNASVLAGDLAFTHVAVWDGAAWVDRSADWQAGTASFIRFCSGYLAGPHNGFDRWIYLTGEENAQTGTFDGLGGLAVAVVDDTAYALTDMGHFAKENVVVLPNTGAKTVVMLLEDGPSSLDSQLYMYVGTKNPAATDPIQRAGLVGGQLYFFRATTAGKTDESNFHKTDGTIAGEWVSVASVLNAGETVRTISDDNLNARVKAAGAFNVIRVEDAAYDRITAGVVYFDTTGSSHKYDGTHFTNKLGRIYKLVVDPANPAGSPAQLTILLEGDAGDPIVNPDNLDTNAQGILMIQEDPNTEHQGAGLLDGLGRDSSIWHYELNTGRLVRVAEVDQAAIASGSATRDAYFLSLLGGKEPATDSASAATAIATGYKTDDGNLAWLPGDPDNGSLTTIAETLRKLKGFAISVVSTVPFSHATPAGFVSHNKSRGNYAAIANEIIYRTVPEVVVAGGNSTYQTGYIAPADQAALKAGQTAYTYVERETGVDGATSLATTASGVNLAAGGKLFGLYGGAGGNVEYYTVADAPGAPAVTRATIENPTLTDMTTATLGVLSQDPDGFFVMLEQGDIDWANHENNFRNMIGGVWDLDSAVRAAEGFVAQPGGPEWSDTLMLVTSDHSNSYMRLPTPLGKGDLPVQNWSDKNSNGKIDGGEWVYPGGEVTYRTLNHTNELVTLWARGQGAGLLNQYAGLWYPGTQIVDNSQLYHMMRRAVDEAGAKHVMLFIGDGMNIEHEIAGSRYLYGTDSGLAWNGWGGLTDGWAGHASTWDVTTYNRYADSLKVAKYDALSFNPVVGYNPGLGGAMPFPVQPDNTIPKWARGSWETSGIIDASAIYGPGAWLLDVQAHTVDSLMASHLQGFSTDQMVAEGGQLLLMTVAPRSLAPQANLSVVKSTVPQIATVGFPLTYTLTVRNGGPDTATGVILGDPLPSEVTFVSATPSQGACVAPRLTCNLGDLPAGGTATVTVVVKPTLAGVALNHASASTTTDDSNPFNNMAMTATVVRPTYRLFLPQVSKP